MRVGPGYRLCPTRIVLYRYPYEPAVRRGYSRWHNFLSSYMVNHRFTMQPIITLFKTPFLKFAELCDQLGILPNDIRECEFFYTYSPPPGELFKVLAVLKRNGVTHGIQFESPQAPKSKKAPKKLNPEVVHL